jgi:signal transduction histidine kinase
MAGDLPGDQLLAAIQALSFARTLDEVTAAVRRHARALTGADGMTFVLRDGAECYYADEDAIAPLWKGRRFPLESCISGWVMQHAQPAVVPDIYADPRIPHEAYRPTFVRSLAMVPVRPEAPVAAIGAYWAAQHAATGSELACLTSLANASSLALSNVQLYEDLQRALAAERRARAEAEGANRLKDEFLATLSHELRTPLSVVHGWLWQLRQPAGAQPIDLHHALEVIERNVNLQIRLVEDLIDASRAMSGALQVEPRLVDLAGVCQAVVEVTRPSAEARGVSLTLELDGHPLVIWGDSDRLQQIVWNLTSNAIKFTPAGGHVSLRAGRLGNRAELSVQDTGIGIDETFLPHVFERFRQGDSSTTRRYGGLGLGLAIVKQLVELHGGTVAARSAGRHAGATFAVSLPIAPVLAEPGSWLLRRSDRIAAGVRLDGIRVLVVDDEPDACEAVRQILRQHGATVRTVTSAAEALAIIPEEAPNVLLADLSMPGTDGYDLIRAVRRLGGRAGRTPAAAFSAFLAAECRQQAQAAGFEGYLEKPVAAGELTRQIARLAQSGMH